MGRAVPCVAEETDFSRLAQETLEELDWCLEQLESFQTHKSVGDLAFTKFKKMLNKELNEFSSESKGASQVANFIFNTYLAMVMVTICVTAVRFPDKTQEFDLSALVEEDEDPPTEPSVIGPSPVTPPPQENKSRHMARIPGVRRLVSHSNSIAKLPKYGVETPHERELDKVIFLLFPNLGTYCYVTSNIIGWNGLLLSIMKSVNEWGIDIFAVAELSLDHPITAVTYSILRDRNLLSAFKISPCTAIHCLMTLEDHYQHVPYHNRTHGADVVQSAHVLLLVPALDNVFSDLEYLALVFAAAIHDVDHPGVTNQFLVNTSDELALMYNDDSILESHSLAVAFKVLQDPSCNIFSSLTRKQYVSLRKMVIDMVPCSALPIRLELCSTSL
ncbi:dnc [Cordylochernes scorpioides]|uniref:3',5'-cyclic-AMP phosphodiesterase n=1 Tax=Cordylochernes scorpioides TaxID=51811 RepID=A0ABY6KHD2_9ARAC|nr:dnc [Cordylochernes scorpioides]